MVYGTSYILKNDDKDEVYFIFVVTIFTYTKHLQCAIKWANIRYKNYKAKRLEKNNLKYQIKSKNTKCGCTSSHGSLHYDQIKRRNSLCIRIIDYQLIKSSSYS